MAFPTAFHGNLVRAVRSGVRWATAIARTSAETSEVCPIAELSLNYNRNKWIICARVSQKTDLKSVKTQNFNGHIFNVDLIDQSGMIRAIGFNGDARRLYRALEKHKVYYISNGKVRSARDRSGGSNGLEIAFSQGTLIEPCTDAALNQSLPYCMYAFTKISDLLRVLPGKFVDVIGMVYEVSDVQTVIKRHTGDMLSMRNVTLMDDTGFCVSMVLWGIQAESFDVPVHSVLAVKNAWRKTFNGNIQLSFIDKSYIEVNPNIDETQALRNWQESVMETTGGYKPKELPRQDADKEELL